MGENRIEMERAELSHVWQSPEFRGPFMDGVTGYAPVFFVGSVGLVSGILLIPLGLPVWFSLNCLFTDRFLWPVDLSACHPYPPFSPVQWAATFVWFAVIGSGYLLIRRASVRRTWRVDVGSVRINPAHLFAVSSAVLTGWVIARVLTSPEVTLSETVVIVTACPFWLRIWWSVRRRAYFGAAKIRPEAALDYTVKIFLSRQFGLADPDLVTVETKETDLNPPGESSPIALRVKGPFDAIDARRINDLSMTCFDGAINHVETTLSDEEYWRHYNEELGPSGYQSPPIPPPLTIPTPLLWGGSVVVLALFIGLFSVGDPLSIDPRHLEGAFQSIGGDIRQMRAGFDPTVDTGIDTDFYFINLKESKKACPSLSRSVMGRWRLRNERFDDRYVYRVHRVSQLDYYGFVIDSVTRSCIKEAGGSSLREAQYRVASRVPAREWVEIDADLDWRYVPPRIPPRD